MNDYLNEIVNVTTDETYFNQSTIETIVRKKIKENYHDITKNGSNGCNVWDYAMYAMINVDWGDLTTHVNNNIKQKLND